MSKRPKAQSFFLPTTLLRWGLAEVLCFLGNLAPRFLSVHLWNGSVYLNRHQEVAAMNRAMSLFESRSEGAWTAFETVLEQLQNPWDTSASDLYLSRTPGRILRRLTTRLLWGPAGSGTQAPHDEQLQSILLRLTTGHFRRELATGNLERAGKALEALASLVGWEQPDVIWGDAELAWRRGEKLEALEHIHPRVQRGDFLSPLDSLRWAERALTADRLDLTDSCLAWGRRFLPEEPRLWRLTGALAHRRGQTAKAQTAWGRTLALDPQDVATVLALESATESSVRGELEVDGPNELPLNASGHFTCHLPEASPEWVLRVLPPMGRGVMPQAAAVPFDKTGRAEVEISSHRPHRVRGEPWPLIFLALGPAGHAIGYRSIQVADHRPGRLLVTVTEDHEIHEERGTLGREMLQQLLVDKSRFASQIGVPWTHMVETGSTLAMPSKAASEGGPQWQRLDAAVRRHLAEEVAQGNDLQPHLHTFNDPAYKHFPYRLSQSVEEQGWRPHLRFLLTAADRRGDWASVCPPPSRAAEGPGLDRLASVERAVTQLEEVGRLGDPNYRPILWRSGLLEYGDTGADRAWSAVALRRAGLLADSDLPKPSSPRTRTISAAFPAQWEEPFTTCPGGPLLQLPIAANLEGDYLMGPRGLKRRAHTSLAATRGEDGQVHPGVHLFTLLTHDKFFNARCGRDEFLLDRNYGDWPVVDGHLTSWREAGAEVVTARQGVEAVLDDLTWHPLPRLVGETFVVGDSPQIHYRLHLLGRDLPATAEFPHELLVPIPCILREHLESIQVVYPETSARRIEPELVAPNTAFWLSWRGGNLPAVSFQLHRRIGPHLLSLEPHGDDCWKLELASDEPFLHARLLLPWELGLPEEKHINWQIRCSQSSSDSSLPLPTCQPQREGLLLADVAFEADDQGHTANLRLELTAQTPSKVNHRKKSE